jgi:hypothetical protein
VLHSPDNTARPLAVDDTRHLLLDGDPLAGFALPWAPGRAFLAGELTFYNGTLYRLTADQGGGLGTPTVVGPTIYQPLTPPTLDPYISATGSIGAAVTAGTFSSGELQGTQPAGSLAGMEFTTATYGYKYQRGATGTLVWNRYAKS